jgi:ATP-dependent RNA helicase DDX19/DBP5
VPAKSLADRISSGEMTSDKPKVEEVDKASATLPSKEKQKEKELKEPETNLIQNKYEVAVKLQDLQADPNSPLYSVKSFDELGL